MVNIMSSDDNQIVDFNDRMYWSLAQLKQAFGSTRDTIGKRLREAGVQSLKKRHGHDVFHIHEASRAILTREISRFEGVKNPEDLPPKERLDWYRGENEKTKCLRESGVLIPGSEVTKEFSRVVKICVRSLETIPDILEMKCAMAPDQVLLVERECDLARDQLANELSAE